MLTDTNVNEALSDDLQQGPVAGNEAPYSSCGEDMGFVSKPSDGAAAAGQLAETASLDACSDTSGDELQWGYKPKSRFTQTLNRLVPHGGAISNIYNMSAVTLGSGIFSLPYAFKSTGIATAIIVLVAISAATIYSVYIMAQAVEKTRALAKLEMANKHNLLNVAGGRSTRRDPRAPDTAEDADCSGEAAAREEEIEMQQQQQQQPEQEPSTTEEKRTAGVFRTLKGGLNDEGNGTISSVFLCSYESLSRGLLGRGWDYLAAFNMWMFCFGSCVSYVITVNDLISTALKPGPGEAPKDGFLYNNPWGSKVLTLVVWAVLMLPLSIPKQINSLRYVSVIGVTCIMYFVVVLIVHSCMNSFVEDNSGAPKLKHKLYAVKSGNEALVGFSMFLFAFLLQTNVLQLQKEATKPSPARITRDCGVATGICTTLYILAGFFGYAEFGEMLQGTILREYNVKNEPAVAVGFVLLGFKLCVSFAICMLPTRDSVYYCIGTNVRTIHTFYHVLTIVVLSALALILGLVIPDVEIVFSLVGSFAGGFLGFVFPALFIMYAGNWSLKSVGVVHWVSTYLLLLSGVVAIVFGTVAAIYGMI